MKMRKRKNSIINCGKSSIIILENKVGKKICEVIVDTEDLPRILEYRWFLGNHGYATSRRLNNTLHSFLMGKRPEGKRDIDHINRNKLDNRKTNLRFASRQLNELNKDCKSVYFNKTNKKWVSEVSHKYLGCFKDKEEAEKCSSDYKLKLTQCL